MHDVRLTNLSKKPECNRICSLPANETSITNHAHAKVADSLFAFLSTKTDQGRRADVRHVTSQFKCVTLRPSDYSIQQVEWRRHYVHDSSGVSHERTPPEASVGSVDLHTSSSTYKNQAGNIHAHRRS